MTGAQCIYADYNATTPPLPEVVEVVQQALRHNWGNASSTHAMGRRARALLEEARDEIARQVGAKADMVLFTSGGTEANNWVLRCAGSAKQRQRHIAVSAAEHPSVLNPALQLRQE